MYAELFQFPVGREGYYGQFGGAFIPEILHETIRELTAAFNDAQADRAFWDAYVALMSSYSCRPTPLTHLENLSKDLGGAQIYVKREDLNHTGAHKVNNVMGQGLLVQRMGKQRVIAETGAGQHGVATATMAARMGFECTIYMGSVDVERQRPNVFWMEQLGARVVSVDDGTKTLKDAINATLRDWADSMHTTHYVMGTVCGPHPFPQMVTYFQSLIGREARSQMLEQTGQLPRKVYACVGGGSNASGIFAGFLDDPEVELVGVEAGGLGLDSGQHAARLSQNVGSTGVAQGYKTRFLQNVEGPMRHTHSLAGWTYVGVGPFWPSARLSAASGSKPLTDADVLTFPAAGHAAARHHPALESTHAFVTALQEAPHLSPQDSILINQSGRGDKDIFTIAEALGDDPWRAFLRHKVGEWDAAQTTDGGVPA